MYAYCKYKSIKWSILNLKYCQIVKKNIFEIPHSVRFLTANDDMKSERKKYHKAPQKEKSNEISIKQYRDRTIEKSTNTNHKIFFLKCSEKNINIHHKVYV